MRYRNFKKQQSRTDFLKAIYEYRHECECGHIIYFSRKKDKLICKCCGRVAYKDDKARFKDKLSKTMKKRSASRWKKKY